MSKKFAEYQKFNLSEINKQVCQDWENGNLFKKSIDTREGYPSFIFYEGPPSANGMPGIHHVMARTIKDTFCRFKTMQGFHHPSVHNEAEAFLSNSLSILLLVCGVLILFFLKLSKIKERIIWI